MTENFNTVEEVLSWRSFSLDDQVYDLSHLNAHFVEYTDEENQGNKIKFIVTYGLHCFTKDSKGFSNEELSLYRYSSPKETRAFDSERYELSKHLPKIIESIGSKSTLVCHAAHGKYAIIRGIDLRGNAVDYFVVFKLFRETKRFRLHVISAYPCKKGKIQKVGFFKIVKKLLEGKNLPLPY